MGRRLLKKVEKIIERFFVVAIAKIMVLVEVLVKEISGWFVCRKERIKDFIFWPDLGVGRAC
jgi:hypothetical protein